MNERTAEAWLTAAQYGTTAWPTVPTVFVYNATVVTVHDGDTIDVDIDWGKRRHDLQQPIRLLGCNAAELSTPGGKAARDNLVALLPPSTKLVLQTISDDKYAPRWDCAVTYLAADGTPHDLVTDLIAANWAAPWNGVGKAPVPPWPRPVSA